MINTPKHIATLTTILSQRTGHAHSTLSRLATGSGTTFDRVSKGHGITYQRLERIFQYFSNNWPDDLPWPKNIDRPTPHPLAPEQKLKARGCKCA